MSTASKLTGFSVLLGAVILISTFSSSLRFFHAPDPKSRIAFVYLAASRPVDVLDLNCSLKTLQANFNEEYGYRIIVMHEDLDQGIRNDLSARYSVEFKEVDLRLDESLNKSYNLEAKDSTREKRTTWGYQNMCRFWFTQVFRNSSILEGLDYYVRLDTDSSFAAKIERDFIREFIESGVSYGHNVVHNTCKEFVTGLQNLALSYAKENIEVADPSRWETIENPRGGKGCVPLYYNNLEFVDIRRFKDDKEIEKWEATVDKNGGIYTYGWGDAPLRYVTATMFLKSDEVEAFSLDSYKHKLTPRPEICQRYRK